MPKVYLKKQTKYKCRAIENYFYSEKNIKIIKPIKSWDFD
jgi:hypothetical protein